MIFGKDRLRVDKCMRHPLINNANHDASSVNSRARRSGAATGGVFHVTPIADVGCWRP